MRRSLKIFFSYKNDTIEDGYLYAYEIDELKNNADLIVLASCFSGSGKINKGEGAISIGRSFMTSGNPSIIFSLWAAYVEPTLFELDIFYKHLVLGKRKDEAMRLAKAAGLSTDVVKEVGAANGNITEQMGMFLGLHEFKPHLSEEEFENLAGGFVAVAEKDLTIALEQAKVVGETLPSCERSLELIAKVYRDEY